MSRPSASELREALRAGLVQRLAPAGWREGSDDGHSLVALACPVGDGFVATIEVWQASSYPDRPPVVVTYMHAGVGFEALQRLAPLLGVFELDVKSAVIWPQAAAEDEDQGEDFEEDEEEEFDEGEDNDDEEQWEGRELRTFADADLLAAELAPVALERAIPYARRYADLDVLLTKVPGPRSGSVSHAALLAAAGRFDEAKASLAQLPPPAPGLGWMREQQRAARQLERWIDSGGDPALIPEAPPPPRYQRSPPPSMSKVWRESRARFAAVDVVRREGIGKDRAELRAMLERELAARGLRESPLWFEQTLDHLHDSSAEKRELLVKGLIGAGKLGIKAFKGIREGRSLPDLSVPDWLEPPARAAWSVPRQHPGRWAEVQISEGSEEWLERVYQAIPRLFGSTASLQAWLDWDANEEHCLAVHIGERWVGRLDESAATACRAVMDAAGERDESPNTQARLTPRPRPAGYLLEVQLPA
jgi:hypothetical protein